MGVVPDGRDWAMSELEVRAVKRVAANAVAASERLKDQRMRTNEGTMVRI